VGEKRTEAGGIGPHEMPGLEETRTKSGPFISPRSRGGGIGGPSRYGGVGRVWFNSSTLVRINSRTRRSPKVTELETVATEGQVDTQPESLVVRKSLHQLRQLAGSSYLICGYLGSRDLEPVSYDDPETAPSIKNSRGIVWTIKPRLEMFDEMIFAPVRQLCYGVRL